MAKIVAAFGSSHSIMLVSEKEDWQHRFREIDPKNKYLYNKRGEKTTYEALLAEAPADAESMVTPEKMAERFDKAEAAMDHLGTQIRAANLDVLLVIGDDQTELFDLSNNPTFAIYYGDTIRNTKSQPITPETHWGTKARMRRHEADADREYPVKSDMAAWLIRQLCDRDFDIAALESVPEGKFEGHAFQFVHKRLLGDNYTLPVIPVMLNTFDPPNQPTPRRCVNLGKALYELIQEWPEDIRVGIIASGGLSHFVVDEELDHTVMDALRTKDYSRLSSIEAKLLQAGSSEIRNWLVMSSLAKDLDLEWMEYVPGYRTPALTGTGLCFASWKGAE